MIESHIKSIRSTKPLMKDQMQLLFTNNNKIFIDLEVKMILQYFYLGTISSFSIT